VGDAQGEKEIMSLSRLVGIFLLIIQLANMGMFLVETYAPESAVIVAAVIGGMQAFVGRIQGSGKV
jgi:hypothetical protein